MQGWLQLGLDHKRKPWLLPLNDRSLWCWCSPRRLFSLVLLHPKPQAVKLYCDKHCKSHGAPANVDNYYKFHRTTRPTQWQILVVKVYHCIWHVRVIQIELFPEQVWDPILYAVFLSSPKCNNDSIQILSHPNIRLLLQVTCTDINNCSMKKHHEFMTSCSLWYQSRPVSSVQRQIWPLLLRNPAPS